MPNTPNVTLNEVDLTFSPDNPPVGVSLVIGETKRGPINKPNQIFTSFEAFRRVHGGLLSTNDFPLLCKRAIERGSAIRVCNIKHYSDIVAGTLAATNATAAASSLVSLDAPLAVGHTITVTVNTVDSVQAFSNSSENTLALLCAKIKLLTGVVEDAFSLGNNSIIIVPKAGSVLTTTVGLTGAGAPVGTVVTEATLEDSANNALFSFTPKYPGAAYNQLMITITAASNGDTDAFDIDIRLLDEPDLAEKYRNLKIIGKPTVIASTYLKDIQETSNLVSVTYQDLSAIVAAQVKPRKFAIRYQTGSDGGTAVDTDYVGSSTSKTGLYSADAYSDMMQVSVLDKSSVAILQGGAAYAAARKDIQFFGWLGDYTTEAATATARDTTLIDTKYCQLYVGKLTVLDLTSTNSTTRNISPMGDVIGIADYSDTNYGAHFSFAGSKRSIIFNALAVVNNFSTPGNYTNMNMLANRQLNLIVVEKNKIYIKGNFTAQKAQSDYSYGNVTRFVIQLKKVLGPFLETFLEDPNDIPTWKTMYLQGYPTLENYKTSRAIEKYSWNGDQFAKDLDSLQVNTKADVALGKYRLRIFLKVIKALNEIGLDIILSPSGVSFEDVMDSLTN